MENKNSNYNTELSEQEIIQHVFSLKIECLRIAEATWKDRRINKEDDVLNTAKQFYGWIMEGEDD